MDKNQLLLNIENFPRLAVVCDVSVESSVAGALLLYRFLADWPVDRLLIIEGNLLSRDSEKSLPGVSYEKTYYTIPRLHTTRFRPIVNKFLFDFISLKAPSIRRRLRKFRAEAILTVTQGHLWYLASKIARQLEIPLHLICHDELLFTTPVPERSAWTVEERFARAYKQAASRLCVSPGMVEEYARRFGVNGTVLYPNRGNDSSPSPFQAKTNRKEFTVGYAGSLWMPGCIEQITHLANALARHDGRVVVFTRDNLGPLESLANVSSAGFIPSTELAIHLRTKADVLFVPMSFSPEERTAVQIAFPSKIADYTAIGLPLLIYGPPYCSAVRWANEYPGVAEVVASMGEEGLAMAVHKLASDPELRSRIGTLASKIGDECFSINKARSVLYRSLGMQID